MSQPPNSDINSNSVTCVSPILKSLLERRLIWSGAGQNKPDAISLKKSTIQKKPPLNLDAAYTIPFGIPEIDSKLPNKGLQQGTIHEFFYNDSLQPKAVAGTIPILLAYSAYTTHLIHLQRDRASNWHHGKSINEIRSIIWIGKRCWPTPLALSAIPPLSDSFRSDFINTSLFIDPPNEASTLWAINLALRSPAIKLIIATCPSISRTTTQRLELSAQKSGATAILLRSPKDITLPSRATTRWEIAPTVSSNDNPSWKITLMKLRGGYLPGLSWIIGVDETNPINTLLTAPDTMNASVNIPTNRSVARS